MNNNNNYNEQRHEENEQKEKNMCRNIQNMSIEMMMEWFVSAFALS